ncbi:ABC transporter substrate-binding protein [Hyphomicrobium sp. DMF-1]|jgi:NitT/TauT family transport system substrate-binding protein|uniref:ABC transporter substrate-binding protein n=1 Tax=Hyphomicrobium sp. DMF-1 TaxID=3019544 RepID=UPI0022EBB318|nr:ABC transporter substrate-binding protein [Hyphomicrobium sp. DMF-1]WBT36816.1 transporter substrate-binding domain-containing protein [Hyphomicrobium sp. DMF-1]
MIDRRRLLASTGVALVAAVSPWPLFAAGNPLRLASVKYGSLSWVIKTIQLLELDKKAGLSFEVVDVASNQAGPIALLGDGADVIVSDWTWAMRQRSLGEKLKFSPYSSALGSLVVPEKSDISGISGLEGKALGVAGSAIDKSWLLLRAYSKKRLGRDMAEYAHPSFGAAPLLAEEIRSGRIDAVLNFWTYAARLTGSGFKQLLTVSDIMKDLGIDPVPSLVGFIWKEDYEATHGAEITKLLSAVQQANDVLATDDAAWEPLRPLVKPASEGEFRSIIASYRAGIPKPWGLEELKAAERLMQVLVEAGDAELMGRGTEFDPKLFHHAAT